MRPVLVSAKHKLVGVPYAEDVKNLFPSAKRLELHGVEHLFVPHGPVETFMLRKLDYDAPAPIMSHYAWPGNVTPFDAQKKTCALLTMNQRAYVLNDLGTGKTKSLLWAWDYLRSNQMCGKLLVLATLSTLNVTWAREVFTTLPHRRYAILHGTREQRLKRLADPDAEIFILNHDGLKVLEDDIALRKDIDVLGIDELAVYRNAGAGKTKSAIKLARTMKWVWGMTGRPIPTAPTDVFGQCKVVTPHTVPKFFGRFRDELMIKFSQFTYKPKPDAVDRAYAAMQPAVRFTLEDVAELPDLIERTVDVELGPKQAKIYKELAKHAYVAMQNHEITAANAGAAMMKLLQISTGWVYSSDKSVVPLDNDLRIQAMVDAIASTSRKVLVFVPFKHALQGISAALTKEEIEHACVSGDTSEGERARIFNLFQQSDKYQVLAAHPQCLAHGLTLTAADTIIWFAPVMSLEIYEQANARIRRVGQKHKQQIIKFQSTPVERKIYRMLDEHQAVQNRLLELFEAASE